MTASSSSPNNLRPVTVTTGFTTNAQGSALITQGNTKVLCTACVTEGVPYWRRGKGLGWVTAEYGMLPGSTEQRKSRPGPGRVDGRSLEIQRLVGRSLRVVVDMATLGERTVWMDCDVLQADGGTRAASITGAYVALALAEKALLEAGTIRNPFITGRVAAVSVGVVDGEPVLDLEAEADARADVDMNVVMDGHGRFIEVQGTAEREPFSLTQMERLLKLAREGISELLTIQENALGKST